MKIFIDTGAFIALTDADDEYHSTAKYFFKEEIKTTGSKFLTTNFVVCETINYLRAKVSHNTAVSFRENLYRSNVIEVVHVNPAIEDEAFRIFKHYNDKDFSFTDCVSFAAMKAKKLKEAFAFDRHFEQYGNFRKLP
ncbi:MAG: PIN domain-containing protein [Nitrospirae bacterium]|nr:PIN domain-containing protein [Nitrospirota bacterium]